MHHSTVLTRTVTPWSWLVHRHPDMVSVESLWYAAVPTSRHDAVACIQPHCALRRLGAVCQVLWRSAGTCGVCGAQNRAANLGLATRPERRQCTADPRPDSPPVGAGEAR